MITVLEVIKKTSEFLTSKGVESSRLNAETLVGHALSLSRMNLYLQFERTLTEAELDIIRPLVRRRSQREPLQYILGKVEFSNISVKVDKRALIPRPETEYLIEKIKEKFSTQLPTLILDLGTGTGAIALALANHFPQARVTAVDTSHEALALAFENIQALGLSERVKPLLSNWFDAVKKTQRFDLIISNPPYLTSEEVEKTMPEVNKHEPHSALIASKNRLFFSLAE
jgi:release factor glutamine methyltransferase